MMQYFAVKWIDVLAVCLCLPMIHVELVFNSPDYLYVLYLYLSPITSLNAWKSQCLLFKLWPLPCQALDLIEATQSISIIGTSSIFWSSSHVEWTRNHTIQQITTNPCTTKPRPWVFPYFHSRVKTLLRGTPKVGMDNPWKLPANGHIQSIWRKYRWS